MKSLPGGGYLTKCPPDKNGGVLTGHPKAKTSSKLLGNVKISNFSVVNSISIFFQRRNEFWPFFAFVFVPSKVKRFFLYSLKCHRNILSHILLSPLPVNLQSKNYLIKLGRFHRHAGIPSDYFGVMGPLFTHAVSK